MANGRLMEVAMRINERRYRVALLEKGITQGQLAVSLGKAPSTVSAWIHGLAKPPATWLTDIETKLGIEPGSLVLPESTP